MESVISAALGQITIYKSLNNSLDMTIASIQDNIKALRDYQATLDTLEAKLQGETDEI